MNINLTLGDGGVLPSTAVVSEATLELRCMKMSTWPGEFDSDTILYPAKLLTDFDESNATHNQSDTVSIGVRLERMASVWTVVIGNLEISSQLQTAIIECSA